MIRRCLFLLVIGIVVSPLEASDPVVREVAPADAAYAPYLRWTPEGSAGRVDWLLVTPEAFVPAFEPLVRHRRELGLAAEVLPLEALDRDALLRGGDRPERLRNLVRELHANWGLRYLVLGADTDLLPARMAPFGPDGPQVHHGEPFAVDEYFGCLDGEWNRDGDARFGEAEPGDDDAPDVEAEVHVGRIPVEDVREVEAYVAKLLLYERPTELDYQNRILYLGGKVFSDGDADRHYRTVQEKFFGPRGFTPRFFTVAGAGASAGDVFGALSEGAGIVSHYHHSFTYNLSLPSGAIDTGNVGRIGNRDRPFLFYSNGCYSNQYTKEGISEAMLLSPDGGAAAFLGSTNTCYSVSLGLEERFWREVFGDRVSTLGEGLSRMRAAVGQSVGVLGFLRLSFNLLGDPATRPWPGRPSRPEFEVKAEKDGTVRVRLLGKTSGPVFASCVQAGANAAFREPVALAGEAPAAAFPPVVGNGEPLRVTVFGERTVPVTKEIPDPVAARVKGVAVSDGKVRVDLDGAPDAELDLPSPLDPGPAVATGEVAGAALRVVVPVLAGADVGFVRGEVEWRFPGFRRMGVPRPDGRPVLVAGPPRIVRETDGRGVDVDPSVEAETTESEIRLTWDSVPGALWVVSREEEGRRRVLTPLPLVNPVFAVTGLPPLTEERFVVSRLGGAGEATIAARTSFPFQRGFPQRIGANLTGVVLADLDGRRGPEILFGDDEKGLWALHADGREVRHAGDDWTFGLFAAIPHGVFEPVVADIDGDRKPEILATSKLSDRKLYAFTRDGELRPGFPVSFGARLMTPPLVGDFDGKRGDEILVVSGFGKTIELVRPDGTKEPYAEIGQYNYGYPLAANLDRDRALEVVVLDGDGKLHLFDEGKEREGFPVDLGGPGRATPFLVDLDRDRKPEIVAVGRGTTRLAVIDPKDGSRKADLEIPGAGKPSNDSFFYPGFADLDGKRRPSILVGTPSKKLFAYDLTKDGLVLRPGFPLDLPAEARGVAAADLDGDRREEIFLSLHDGQVFGLTPDGELLPGFPLQTKADTYAPPVLADLDGDGDLELFLGAADGQLRVWDLP